MTTPEFSTWSRISSSDNSLSPSTAIAVCELVSDMLPHKRIWRPWSTAIDAPRPVPLRREFLQRRVQHLAVLAADEKSAVPDQTRWAVAGLAARTVGDGNVLQR